MGNRMTFGVVVALSALVVVGCAAAPMNRRLLEGEKAGAPASMPTQMVEAPMEEMAESDSGARGSDYSAVERLIIRNASLDIVVRDTESVVEEISALTEELGGYTVESNISEYDEGKRAHLQLRVPAEDLDLALERIRKLSMEVRRETVTGQDVTDEYVDVQSRLRHLEATEERLLTFMEEAEDTEAALEVYDRLQNIQAQIEQAKGRMEYLEQSAAMATITLDITPSELAQPIQVGRWRPQGTLRDAFESLIRVFQFLVDALIIIVVLVLPVVLIIALPLIGLFFLIRGILRRRRRAKQAE